MPAVLRTLIAAASVLTAGAQACAVYQVSASYNRAHAALIPAYGSTVSLPTTSHDLYHKNPYIADYENTGKTAVVRTAMLEAEVEDQSNNANAFVRKAISLFYSACDFALQNVSTVTGPKAWLMKAGSEHDFALCSETRQRKIAEAVYLLPADH